MFVEMKLPKNFSHRLKRFLLEKDVPYTKAAVRCGVSTKTIWELANGRRDRVNDRTHHKLNKAFPSLFKDAA